MAQSKAFVEASHAINELSHSMALLEAENAKLRSARDVWQENDAMLRELVRDMWAYITEPVGKRNNLKERLARFDDIADRMRELGVDEC